LLIMLSGWGLMVTGWALSPSYALESWGKVSGVLLAGLVAYYTLKHSMAMQQERMRLALIFGFVVAVLFLIFEVGTGGIISRAIRQMIGSGRGFLMHDLNRGATFLALIAWPFMLAVVRQLEGPRRYMAALGLWVVVLGILLQLESMSAIMGFLGATLVFLYVYLLRGHGLKLLAVLAAVLVLALPHLARQLDSNDMPGWAQNLPDSNFHRLLIWEFVMQNAKKRPWLGYGMNASKFIPGAEERIIYNRVTVNRWQRLPSHPHNAVLQLWLDMGYVGVILYAFLLMLTVEALRRSHLPLPLLAASLATLAAYGGISLTAFNVWQEWWVASAWFAALYLVILRDPVPAPACKTVGS
ncbi:MAG: O-antigen ligase family protein, partial [Rickettsiales bacterium]|nr:O-antigen ligase family protein [Rickettsiales bacterium]